MIKAFLDKGYVLIVLSALFTMVAGSVMAQEVNLPQRALPRPATTNSVPHVQINPKVFPEITREMIQRVAKIQGVEIRDTIISLPGAKGFWLSDNVPLKNPQAIVRGREFAHVHPDGSLHAALHPSVAKDAVETGWATYHPWAKQRQGWDGFVMIYTPTSDQELDIVMGLIVSSYNFITGRSIQ